jgi:hypothetical protein
LKAFQIPPSELDREFFSFESAPISAVRTLSGILFWNAMTHSGSQFCRQNPIWNIFVTQLPASKALMRVVDALLWPPMSRKKLKWKSQHDFMAIL